MAFNGNGAENWIWQKIAFITNNPTGIKVVSEGPGGNSSFTDTARVNQFNNYKKIVDCGCTEKLSNTYLCECEPLEILYSSRRFSNNLRVHMNMNRQKRFHEMFCFREYVCEKRMFNCSMPSLTTSTHGKLFYFGERKKN